MFIILLGLLVTTSLFCDFDFDQAHAVFKTGNDEAIIKFIEHSGLDSRDKYKNGFFHYAMNYKLTSIIDYLINHGANLKLRNHLDQTPLMEAVTLNNFDWVKMFVDNKADIQVKTIQGDNSLFHLAAAMRTIQPEILDYLLTHNLSINEVNKSGKTPLEFAFVMPFNYPIVKYFITHGADINKLKDKQGRNILHRLIEKYDRANSNEMKELISLILAKPGSEYLLSENYTDLITNKQFTPAEYAAKEGHPKLVPLLQVQDDANVARNLRELYQFLAALLR